MGLAQKCSHPGAGFKWIAPDSWITHGGKTLGVRRPRQHSFSSVPIKLGTWRGGAVRYAGQVCNATVERQRLACCAYGASSAAPTRRGGPADLHTGLQRLTLGMRGVAIASGAAGRRVGRGLLSRPFLGTTDRLITMTYRGLDRKWWCQSPDHAMPSVVGRAQFRYRSAGGHRASGLRCWPASAGFDNARTSRVATSLRLAQAERDARSQ